MTGTMAAKPEQNLWNWLRDAMGNAWDAARHEKTTNVADVSFACGGCDGWIELKVARHTLRGNASQYAAFDLSWDHFTAGQRHWLQARGQRGSGHCFVLIRIPRHKLHDFEYLLIHWTQIHQLGVWTLADFREEAALWWSGPLNISAFADALRRKGPRHDG